jgi:hypothetical protein
MVQLQVVAPKAQSRVLINLKPPGAAQRKITSQMQQSVELYMHVLLP